jgi:uncharacterized membrane protein (DUF485 family)
MATNYDWDAIAESPKFRELHRRKTKFLFGWWAFAAVFYLLLLLGAGYAPDLFKVKVIGNINVCYLFALLQFLSSWGIAMYYAHVANKDFDRLTLELVDELEKKGRVR